MRQNKIKVLLLIVSLIFIQFSCWDRSRNCRIQVTNLTEYRINALELQDFNNTYTISIEPNSTSEVFTFNFEYRDVILAPSYPPIYITVTSYSDSIKTYTNSIGHVRDIKDLSETKINKFTVELNPDYKDENSIPFLVTLIE